MLAYMKMSKSEDDAPWFDPPLRFPNEYKQKTKLMSMDTQTKGDMQIGSKGVEDDERPLCLVIDKNKRDSQSTIVSHSKYGESMSASPVRDLSNSSPVRDLSMTDSSPVRDLSESSPLRVSVSVSPESRFEDEKMRFLNPLSMFSTNDFIDFSGSIFQRALEGSVSRRTRGEKKAIPVEQKDEKYYERRKRNNAAAKKSRDARKSREDDIALRASTLEQENAVLRAQLLTLKEEADSLQLLLVQKRNRSQ